MNREKVRHRAIWIYLSDNLAVCVNVIRQLTRPVVGEACGFNAAIVVTGSTTPAGRLSDVFGKTVAVNSQKPTGRFIKMVAGFCAICQYFGIESSISMIRVRGVEIRIAGRANRDESPQSIVAVSHYCCIGGEKRINLGIEETSLLRCKAGHEPNFLARLLHSAHAGIHSMSSVKRSQQLT